MSNTEVVSGNTIKEGDLVLLWFEDEKTYLLKVGRGKKHPIHCGRPIPHEDLIGKEFGSFIEGTSLNGFYLKPSTEDLMFKASRESGVVYSKDAALLAVKLGIHSGKKVLEIGTGSGALTLFLAHQVAPTGKICTYDLRADLPVNAVRNIERSDLQNVVEFNRRQKGDPFPENAFDAVILDIPTPWEEVELVKKALKGGGRLCSLNPTINQVERMAETLREQGFINVEALELLERKILARAGKSRPEMRMIGHTEYMLFATRVGEIPPRPLAAEVAPEAPVDPVSVN